MPEILVSWFVPFFLDWNHLPSHPSGYSFRGRTNVSCNIEILLRVRDIEIHDLSPIPPALGLDYALHLLSLVWFMIQRRAGRLSGGRIRNPCHLDLSNTWDIARAEEEGFRLGALFECYDELGGGLRGGGGSGDVFVFAHALGFKLVVRYIQLVSSLQGNVRPVKGLGEVKDSRANTVSALHPSQASIRRRSR